MSNTKRLESEVARAKHDFDNAARRLEVAQVEALLAIAQRLDSINERLGILTSTVAKQ